MPYMPYSFRLQSHQAEQSNFSEEEEGKEEGHERKESRGSPSLDFLPPTTETPDTRAIEHADSRKKMKTRTALSQRR